MSKLKTYMVENFGLAADATEEALKTAVSEKIKSGELSLEKYDELVSTEKSATNRLEELFQKQSEQTAKSLENAFAKMMEASKPTEEPKPEPESTEKSADEKYEELLNARMQEMEKKFAEKFGDAKGGDDGAELMKMAYEDNDEPRNLRVKSAIERYNHNLTAQTYKSGHSKHMGLHGQPMEYNGKEVNRSTDRTKYMTSVWMKFQMFPENMTETETETVRYILHREKFHVPDADPKKTESRLLTPSERDEIYSAYKNCYKTVIDNSGTGGEYAVPEFFDMDLIVTPTLADENIASFCNVVPVNRGSSAQNFVLGRPTIGSHTEGSALTPFSTTGFITNHDTDFFRAMGAIEVGKNFAEDAHPRRVSEIQERFRESAGLWFNEQIVAGDGTTEPQGITVASNTVDVTPANPTTGAVTLNDAMDMLFGVGKAHRQKGGRMNAAYIMTEDAYKRFRRIATGVTGDTRLVFGDDIESYEIFNHPVLIEENGLDNTTATFAQLKGYRLYLRQGLRFFREDRGATLTYKNSFIIGCDLRAGGQLDEGAYAAVVDGFPA